MNILTSLWHLMCQYPIPTLGIWIVYKFQHFIFRKKPEPGEVVGKYKSYQEARYKSLKEAQKQYPNQPIDIQDDLDYKGRPFFAFTILHTIVKIIFVPVHDSEYDD